MFSICVWLVWLFACWRGSCVYLLIVDVVFKGWVIDLLSELLVYTCLPLMIYLVFSFCGVGGWSVIAGCFGLFSCFGCCIVVNLLYGCGCLVLLFAYFTCVALGGGWCLGCVCALF